MGVIEKSSYIFYFSITLETIHGMMIRGDIMFPYKTDLLGAFDDSACPSSSGGSFFKRDYFKFAWFDNHLPIPYNIFFFMTIGR